jgi:hypothetical protein
MRGGDRRWWEWLSLWVVIIAGAIVLTLTVPYAFTGTGTGTAAEASRLVVTGLAFWGMVDLGYSLYRRLVRAGSRRLEPPRHRSMASPGQVSPGT